MHSIVLGKGASGTVYQGSYNNNDVAVKIFKEGSKGSDGNAVDEARINGLIDHPLAISAIGVIMDGKEKTYRGMVMNLLSGTYPLGKIPNFDTVTRDEGPSPHSKNLSMTQVYSVVWNVALVLEYIHSSIGVSHGDVYLHNVLRDGQFVARLSDWGASFVYNRDDAELTEMLERIEVLAFGRLVQDLLAWHLRVAVPDTTGSTSYFDSFLSRDKSMEMGAFKELLASILQPDQTIRPNFRAIKEKLESMSEFNEFKR
jgi:serine/threonine protein kinase